jgi:colanic acid biosynthesis glycosyl transferase WcaI
MRLTILTQYYPPEVGAPQARLSAIARELSRRGHEVEIVTAMPNYPIGEVAGGYRWRLYLSESVNEIRIRRSWIYAATGTGLKRIWNYLSFLLSSFFSLMFANKPDVLFVESPPLFLGLNAVILKKLRKIPYIFNVADIWPDSVRELGVIENKKVLYFLSKLEETIYSESLFVNAVTEGIYENITNDKGVEPGKVVFFPNGVDTNVFHPVSEDPILRERMGLGDEPMFVYPGTIGLAQGLDVVLHAARILEEEGTAVTILLLGAGSDRPRLQGIAQEMAIKSVRFLDPVAPEVVNQVLALSVGGLVTLKKLPILEGARPSKMFPIMAAGKPIVFSGDGEAARVIHEAGCGLTCEAENELQLAAAFRWCIENRESAEEMGESGRQFVEANLSWPVLVSSWLDRVGSFLPT